MPKKIIIPSAELWDAKNEIFVYSKEQTIVIEHSLVSLSKWESKWHKPFLTKEKKTTEETIDYVRCMTLTQNVNPEVYNYLTNKNLEDIHEYIEDSMTATWFNEEKKNGVSSKQITAELLYYWMISFNIPMECQKWHLNRLITLIKVCSEENKPKKKMSKKELYSRNAAINAARRKKHTH